MIWKVTLSVVIEYRHYAPPNFQNDFLRGREAYFWSGYYWAFYLHLLAGPPTLILGPLLISERFRQFAPAWHRRLGRVQATFILLLLTPSGLCMAFYAMTGAVAAVGLGTLAIATAACVGLGWRAAMQRRFAEHRLWMWRTFLLLCSAVLLRLIGGFATVLRLDAEWFYPFSTWASRLGPLLVYEVWRLLGRQEHAFPEPQPATVR